MEVWRPSGNKVMTLTSLKSPEERLSSCAAPRQMTKLDSTVCVWVCEIGKSGLFFSLNSSGTYSRSSLLQGPCAVWLTVIGWSPVHVWCDWTPCATWLTINFDTKSQAVGFFVPDIIYMPLFFYVNNLIVQSLWFIVCFFFLHSRLLGIVHFFSFFIVLRCPSSPFGFFWLPRFCCCKAYSVMI